MFRSFSQSAPSLPLPDLMLGFAEEAPPSSHSQRDSDREDPFGNLTPSNLHSMLEDPTSHQYSDILIIDGRFAYEFRAGHIQTAKNVSAPSEMIEVYTRYQSGHACVVFHCEYSQDRGPRLMWAFRGYDRQLHEAVYPKLSFPDVFLLTGGYRRFFRDYPQDCQGAYVEMRDRSFVESGEYQRVNSQYAREWAGIQRGSLLSRARSQEIGLRRVSQIPCDIPQRPSTPTLPSGGFRL
jgi:hypothetical protein